jgi:hypothetical protein
MGAVAPARGPSVAGGDGARGEGTGLEDKSGQELFAICYFYGNFYESYWTTKQ